MNRVSWLVIFLALVACERDRAADRERGDGSGRQSSSVSERKIGPLPMDTLKAALQDYDAKRISADSAAALIASYQQRTGRPVTIDMDAELRAAMERQNQRRKVP